MTDKRRKLTDRQVEQLQTLYKTGMSVRLIAAHFSIAAGTVRHHTAQGHMIKFTPNEVLEAIAA